MSEEEEVALERTLDTINGFVEDIIDHVGLDSYLWGYLTLALSTLFALGLDVLGKIVDLPLWLTLPLGFIIPFMIGLFSIRYFRKWLVKKQIKYHLSKEEYEHTGNQQGK